MTCSHVVLRACVTIVLYILILLKFLTEVKQLQKLSFFAAAFLNNIQVYYNFLP